MSTKWQESCLRALMEGPSSYKVFEKSSYNRQAVIQYRSRLFPMYVVKKKKKQKQKREITKNEIAWFKIKEEILKGYSGDNQIKCRNMYENGKLNIRSIANTLLVLDPAKLKKQYESSNIRTDDNLINTEELCKFRFEFVWKGYRDTDYGWYAGSNSYSISSFFKKENLKFSDDSDNRLYSTDITEITISYIEFTNCQDRVDIRLPALLQSIEECLYIENENTQIKSIPAIKGKTTYCNFGIEIEYEGTPVPNSLKSKLLQLGAVDFNSGIDGCSDTIECLHHYYNDNETPDRLYEVRLRIDGFRGLPALYHLVDYMLNTECHIPNKGSIHCHVDHAWDIPAQKNPLSSSVFREKWLSSTAWVTQENRLKLEEVLKSIFNFSYATFDEFKDSDRCRFQTVFKTIEYRFMTPLLNYKSIVADIMTVSHMDQCYKQNKPLNLSLLTAIDKVKKEVLNQRPIQLSVPDSDSAVLRPSEEPAEEIQSQQVCEAELTDILGEINNSLREMTSTVQINSYNSHEESQRENLQVLTTMLDGNTAVMLRDMPLSNLRNSILGVLWEDGIGCRTTPVYFNRFTGNVYGRHGERLTRIRN